MKSAHLAWWLCVLLLLAGCSGDPDAETGDATSRETGGDNSAAFDAADAHFGMVQPNDEVLVHINVKTLRTSSLLKAIPEDQLEALGPGIPADEAWKTLNALDHVWLCGAPPAIGGPANAPPPGSFLLKFAEAEGYKTLLPPQVFTSKTQSHNGKEYFAAPDGGGFLYIQDSKTLFITTEEPRMKTFLEGKAGDMKSSLISKMKGLSSQGDIAAVFEMKKLAAFITNKDSGFELPPSGGPVDARQILETLRSGTLVVDLSGGTMASAVVHLSNSSEAKKLHEDLTGFVATGNTFLAFLSPPPSDDEPTPIGELVQLGKDALAGVKVSQQGDSVSATVKRPKNIENVFNLLAALQSPLDQLNNAKQMAIGALNYHDTFRKWPENIQDGDGQPLLSWRVAILPFIEAAQVYDQFDQTAAWDSDANKTILTDTVIDMYQTPGAGDPTTTTYKLIPNQAGGILFVVGGVGSDVPWTKPDVVTIDKVNPLMDFGAEPDDGFIVANADGSVEQLTGDELKARLTAE